MLPQWPLVVTANMLQFPSNWAAIAGGAEQMVAKANDRAKAHRQLPVMKVLIPVLPQLTREAPANGGHTGASGSVAGEPVMGEGNPITYFCTPPFVFVATTSRTIG